MIGTGAGIGIGGTFLLILVTIIGRIAAKRFGVLQDRLVDLAERTPPPKGTANAENTDQTGAARQIRYGDA